MKSIRPLVTITILTVVGIILYHKIQDGPAVNSEFDTTFGQSAPGLSETAGTPSPGNAENTPAPWNPSATTETTVTQPTPLAAAPVAAPTALPAIPEVPELPPMEGMTQNGLATAPGISGQVPSLGTATPDRTAMVPVAAPTAVPAAGGSSPYASTKPLIQSALERGELPRAHLLLTQFYGNRSLPAAEQEEINTLLSQLAGTVIYSGEHRLEPAYTVKPGETLEMIAQQYNVPWKLLAKINGAPTANAIQPGQKLKVMRGPFTAMVTLSAGELALQLDGRFAGRFDVVVPSLTALGDGEWVVESKLLTPSSHGITQVSTAPPLTPPTIDRALVLRNTSPTSPVGTITIGSGNTQVVPDTAAVHLKISQQAAEEIFDILSIGSRVITRR